MLCDCADLCMCVCARTHVIVACLDLLASLRSQSPNQIGNRREWMGQGKSEVQKKTDQRARIRVHSDNVSAGVLHDAFGLHL